MEFSSKTILLLAVVVCVFQAIEARPRYDANFLENVKFDLIRKTMGVEKDFEKDVMNLNYKVRRDAYKLNKKALKPGATECIESARLSAEEQIEEKAQELRDCIEDVKGLIESGIENDAQLAEILNYRSNVKNKLNLCKKTSKTELKGIQKEFQTTGKGCLV